MVVDNEKAIEILTGIQKYCKDKSWCNVCPLGRDKCNELFGEVAGPSDWEINLKTPKNTTEKEGMINMSNTNKMKEIAGIFGLEIGEDFNITCNREYSEYIPHRFTGYNPHRFTEDGLKDKDGDETPIPTNLMRGVYTIEKLPFRPKEGERYYSFGFNLTIISLHWTRCKYDMERKLLGIVFRTEQEAIEYLPIYKKRLEGEEV